VGYLYVNVQYIFPETERAGAWEGGHYSWVQWPLVQRLDKSLSCTAVIM
jgi:hypothetical protein